MLLEIYLLFYDRFRYAVYREYINEYSSYIVAVLLLYESGCPVLYLTVML